MHSFFDRRAVSGPSSWLDGLSADEWRLRHELRSAAAMALGGVQDEGMAQPHIAGLAGSCRLGEQVGERDQLSRSTDEADGSSSREEQARRVMVTT